MRIRTLVLRTLFAGATLAAAAATASPAGAQPLASAWGNNGYFSFNGLYEVSTQDATIATAQTINAETATITATQSVGKRPLFDVTAGGRLYKNLGAGFGVTYGMNNKDARVGGSIPHPFYFNQPRTLNGTTSLDRTDLMVHIAAMALLPISPKVQATVFGGPTWFQVKPQVIKEITVTDTYPYDTVSLSNVTRDRKTTSQWGYHAGVDLSCFFSHYVGIQGMVRYSSANASIDNNGVRSDLKLGGLHAGVGLRVRY